MRLPCSDAGFLLLQQVEQKHRMIEKLLDFFIDKRDQNKITHSLGALLKQRIFGICQGYEDLNDHERLRDDPLLQYICGRDDKTPFAGKSTLNRLELGHELDEKTREGILVNLVGAIRARFPDVRIIFRGDSGFCRESILKQCEVMSTVHAAIWRIASKNSNFICLPTALPAIG